jgi:hypothetical protein
VRYIDNLIENCLKAKKAAPVREFVMTTPSDLADVKQAIYIIEQVGGDPAKTFLDFSRFRQSTPRACAKLNSPSPVMYVGSSTTNPSKRISDHLGEGHEKTSALHLKHWFTGVHKITVKVYDVPTEVLQIIEDDLSDALRPAFGKLGGNNRVKAPLRN